MHIADPETGNLGANAIVGGSAGIATGAAFSAKQLGNGRVAVCFFGEGALAQGLFYETMNMAQLWKLPVIYVCENNMYNEYTHFSESTAGELVDRAKAFAIHTEIVDGQNIQEVYKVTQKLVARARNGEGPSFLQADTYRYYGHHVGDINRTYYRPKKEEEDWKSNRDPLMLMENWLLEMGVVDKKMFEKINKEVIKEIEAGAEFAIKAPYPDLDEVYQHVYS